VNKDYLGLLGRYRKLVCWYWSISWRSWWSKPISSKRL